MARQGIFSSDLLPFRAAAKEETRELKRTRMRMRAPLREPARLPANLQIGRSPERLTSCKFDCAASETGLLARRHVTAAQLYDARTYRFSTLSCCFRSCHFLMSNRVLPGDTLKAA